MTGDRETDLMNAANMLLDARRTGTLLQDLPTELRPVDMDEVYAVQDLVAQAYGPVGGWKIGAPNPETTPLYAPMPLAWIAPANGVVSGRYRGLEAEIAFLVGEDLPPRATPYTRPEVLAAMASCHPVIEELESAFVDPATTSRFSSLADLQMHGGFIYGAPFTEWTTNDWAAERVTLATDGVLRVERTGSNNLRRFAGPARLSGEPRRGAHRRPATRSVDHHRLLDRQHHRLGRLQRRRDICARR